MELHERARAGDLDAMALTAVVAAVGVGEPASWSTAIERLERAAKLGSAFADAQLVEAAVALHGLKGVLPLFCAAEMAQRIIDLEAVCKTGALDAARLAWPVLRANMLELREEVRVIIEKAA